MAGCPLHAASAGRPSPPSPPAHIIAEAKENGSMHMILMTLAVAEGSTAKGGVIHKQANINNTHGHDKWNLWWQAASFAIHDTGFSVA